MDALEKWMIILFTPYQTSETSETHPFKIYVIPKYFLQIILAAKWLVRHSSTVRTFPSVFILILWFPILTNKFTFT